MSIELRGLRTVIYPAPDLSVARDWWAAFLGQEPYFDEPFYVGFSVAGYELGLLPDGDPTEGPLVYGGVDDVDVSVAAAVAQGARVHTPAAEVGEGIITATVLNPLGGIVGFIRNPHFTLSAP